MISATISIDIVHGMSDCNIDIFRPSTGFVLSNDSRDIEAEPMIGALIIIQ